MSKPYEQARDDAAENRSKRQNSSGDELLDKAISRYLRIGFEAGSDFGRSYEHKQSAQRITELEKELELEKASHKWNKELLNQSQELHRQKQNSIPRKDVDVLINELWSTLSYLEWREDDLIGDDLKGDGRLTARFKNKVSSITKAVADFTAKHGGGNESS